MSTGNRPMTLFELMDWYILNSPRYRILKKNSKIAYKGRIANIKKAIEDTELSHIRYSIAGNWYNILLQSYSQTEASYCMKLISIVLNEAIREELISTNPVKLLSIKKPDNREIVWTKTQYKEFITACENNNYNLLKFTAQLCLNLGQRPIDILEIKNSDIIKTSTHYIFKIKQNKTGARVSFPLPIDSISQEFKLKLQSSSEYLLSKNNNPYSYKRMNIHFNDIKKQNPLFSNIQMRDLRRTSLSLYAALGTSEDRLLQISGHMDRDSLSTYIQLGQEINFRLPEESLHNALDRFENVWY